MQDYEITEIKLAVAKEEGHATRGFGSPLSDLAIEAEVAGLHVISLPHPKGSIRIAVITDPLDLSLLGFGEDPLLVFHQSDVDALENDGCALSRDLLSTRPALGEWWFLPVSLDESEVLKSKLNELFPDLD